MMKTMSVKAPQQCNPMPRSQSRPCSDITWNANDYGFLFKFENTRGVVLMVIYMYVYDPIRTRTLLLTLGALYVIMRWELFTLSCTEHRDNAPTSPQTPLLIVQNEKWEHLWWEAVKIIPSKGEGLDDHVGQTTLLGSVCDEVQALTISGQMPCQNHIGLISTNSKAVEKSGEEQIQTKLNNI